MLTHYKAAKEKSPETSAFVPRWHGGSSWRKMLKGMRLLHEYPAGQPLYLRVTKEGPYEPLVGADHPIQVWWDPPASRVSEMNLPGVAVAEPWQLSDDSPRVRKRKLMRLEGREGGVSMKFQAVLHGSPAKVLLDTALKATGSLSDSQRRRKCLRLPVKASQLRWLLD